MSFTSFPLDTLGLKQSILNACTRAGLATAGDVLLSAPADLAKKLHGASGVPIQIPDLVQAVSGAIAPQSHTVLSLLELTPPHHNAHDASPNGRTGEHTVLPVPKFISTGDATLDAMLGGGVRVGAITEITGESAAGKSHLTLSLAVAAQLPPSPTEDDGEESEERPRIDAGGGGTIILTSERILTTTRLIELAEGLREQFVDPPPVEEILDNVHTSRVVDIDALEHALAFAVPPLLAARRKETHSPLMGQLPSSSDQPLLVIRPPRPRELERGGRGDKPIRLLVIDSITALLRGETERSSSSLTQRSRYMAVIGDRLKALAQGYELAVVVINQVKDVFAPGFGNNTPITSGLPGVTTLNGADGITSLSNPRHVPSSQASSLDRDDPPPMLYATQARHFSGQSQGIAKEAALGIVWANVVNTRVMLARTLRRRIITNDDLRGVKRARGPLNQSERARDGEEDKILIRRAHLVFSPHAPPAMLDFVILHDGIRTLPATGRLVDLGPALRRRDLRLRAALPIPTVEEPGPHLGSDLYDEMDIPPELWEGLEDVDEPGSPLA